MTATESRFPPSTPPSDKAKYRQFLIDQGLDPNLNPEGLERAFAEKDEAERTQVQSHWQEFLAASR